MSRQRANARGSDAAPRTLPALDGMLLASAALLGGLGIVMNYSTTAPLAMGEVLPPLALRHLAGVLAALVCATLASRVPLVAWRRLALPIWIGAAGLLAATLLFGIEANGARRWLTVPGLPIALQPAEFARLATVLALAAVLSRRRERARHPAPLRPALVLVAVPSVLLLLQPDFSGAALLVLISGGLLFAGGLPLRLLVAPAVVAAAGAAAYVGLNSYALARVRGFFEPWENASGEGFQLVQSFVAFGRGGSFGVGLGASRQKLFFLPEAHTDFILSVVAEELGLVGVMVVLGSFAAFTIAGLRVARRARDPFALLVAFGMTSLVAVPALINAAVVMGLLPTTGLTLPLVSHGSNSLLCMALAVGVLLRIGMHEAAPGATRVAGASRRGVARR